MRYSNPLKLTNPNSAILKDSYQKRQIVYSRFEAFVKQS